MCVVDVVLTSTEDSILSSHCKGYVSPPAIQRISTMQRSLVSPYASVHVHFPMTSPNEMRGRDWHKMFSNMADQQRT